MDEALVAETTGRTRVGRRLRPGAVLPSLAAWAFAVLAGQHHLLHLLLVSFGLGGAGAGAMTTVPLVRRAMLLLALVLSAMTMVRLRRRPAARGARLVGAASILVTFGLIARSVILYGL